MTENPCPWCSYPSSSEGVTCDYPGSEGGTRYSCQNCGAFVIPIMVEHHFFDNGWSGHPKELSKISHAIKKMQNNTNLPPTITEKIINEISKHKNPTVVEQVDSLILWMGDNSSPGKQKTITPETHQAVIGAINREGVRYILTCMFDTFGFLHRAHSTTPGIPPDEKVGVLTPKGWEHYEQLKRGTITSRKAFMAMKFKDETLDGVYRDCFKSAVEQTGFDLQTVLEEPKAGLIDEKIKVEILTARFVIADLTHGNQGVYWEAGFAEGLGKPVIYTCGKKAWDDKKTHFDTNHRHTVIWDENELTKTAENLKATIRATLRGEAKLTDDQN